MMQVDPRDSIAALQNDSEDDEKQGGDDEKGCVDGISGGTRRD